MRRPRNARPWTRSPGSRVFATPASRAVRLRHRFTFRDDSLWWFAELYLHKQQVISTLFRALTALETLVERERPRALQFVRGGAIVQGLAPQVAAARHIPYHGPRGFRRSPALRLAAMEARASGLNAAALASRLRARVAAPSRMRATAVAFVHRAFWRADSGDGSAEAYIGPVLAALERRLGDGALAYVSVGPASNFRARRWWHPLRAGPSPGTAHRIEAYAPLAKLAASRAVWRERHRMRRALWTSADLRARSVDPRLRLLADRPRGARGHRPPAVAMVGARDGRSGGGARRVPAACRRHLRGSRRVGPGDRARKPPARHPVGRPAARVHLPALAQLPARAGRNDDRRRARCRSGLPKPDPHAALRRVRGAPPDRQGTLPARYAGRDRQPAPRRARERRQPA